MSPLDGSPEAYRKVVRLAADEFVMAVAVTAERENRDAAAMADEALTDALARLTETGVISREWS